MTHLFYDPLFLEHRPGPGHPERPERLQAIVRQLERLPLAHVQTQNARPATLPELERAHPPEFVSKLLSLRGVATRIDEDTSTSPQSVDAAVLAAGVSVQAVENVLWGKTDNAFALVRPPGHHAEPARAMGFCFFNNVAIAAQTARELGVERVAILDWDVHHGNGTQACFYGRRDVLFASAHQFPFYPGTGAAEEVGEGQGMGFTVNCPLPAGMMDADYGAAFHDVFMPVLSAFRPGLLLVSAGFDAHERDPLAEMHVTERGFAAMASAARSLANEVCDGKLVVLLEGGYDLDALAASVHACLECMGSRKDGFPDGVSNAGRHAVAHARRALKPYWKGL
jgi:acetoin utilization deacetylase AcuC-like enzyme